MSTLHARFLRGQQQLQKGSTPEVLNDLYDIMLEAKQTGESVIADHAMTLLEQARRRQSPPVPSERAREIARTLPPFARQVLNQSTWVLERPEQANCINAALNFSEFYPRFEPYTPMEFLKVLQENFQQLPSGQDYRFGDLAVAWSRAENGAWDQTQIQVARMKPQDPLFPYGLIFDHVMVRVSDDIVFHKPDPTPQSFYLLDFVSAAIASTNWRKGFELTYHRKKDSSLKSP